MGLEPLIFWVLVTVFPVILVMLVHWPLGYNCIVFVVVLISHIAFVWVLMTLVLFTPPINIYKNLILYLIL